MTIFSLFCQDLKAKIKGFTLLIYEAEIDCNIINTA